MLDPGPPMNAVLDWIGALSPGAAAGWLLAENVALFVLAALLGEWAVRRFARHPVVPPPDPLEAREVAYAATNVVLNWLITFAGWALWRRGFLAIRRDSGLFAWLDVAVLLLVMDFAMYVLHRVAHLPWLYPIHSLHHRYDRPRPLDLFVLHPLENLGFGSLWLLVVSAHAWSWLGMSVYLAINLASGTLGHLGVEPFPGWWSRVPLLRELGTSTFHAQHHRNVRHNFGFYTLLWDRLFGTLVSDYDARFRHDAAEPETFAHRAIPDGPGRD